MVRSNWIDYQSIHRKLNASVFVCDGAMQLVDVGNLFNQQHVMDTRSDALLSVSSHAMYINNVIHLTKILTYY